MAPRSLEENWYLNTMCVFMFKEITTKKKFLYFCREIMISCRSCNKRHIRESSHVVSVLGGHDQEGNHQDSIGRFCTTMCAPRCFVCHSANILLSLCCSTPLCSRMLCQTCTYAAEESNVLNDINLLPAHYENSTDHVFCSVCEKNFFMEREKIILPFFSLFLLPELSKIIEEYLSRKKCR